MLTHFSMLMKEIACPLTIYLSFIQKVGLNWLTKMHFVMKMGMF